MNEKFFAALAFAIMTFTASGSIAVLADDFVIEIISFFLVSKLCFSKNIFSNYLLHANPHSLIYGVVNYFLLSIYLK